MVPAESGFLAALEMTRSWERFREDSWQRFG